MLDQTATTGSTFIRPLYRRPGSSQGACPDGEMDDGAMAARTQDSLEKIIGVRWPNLGVMDRFRWEMTAALLLVRCQVLGRDLPD